MKKVFYILLPVLIVAALVLSCAKSYTVIPDNEIKAFNDKIDSQKTRYLAASMHYGVFWDDDRYYYVSPFLPASLTYLSSFSGENIPPPPPIDILPAGTPVRVKEVEFPTAAVVTSRVLKTPRYFPWVYLEASTPAKALAAVLVIPAGGKEPVSSIERKIDTLLLTKDPGPELEKLTQKERDAIAHKKVFIGMSVEAAAFALGPAPEISSDHHGKNFEAVWKYYDGVTYFFTNGKLEKIK